MKFTSETSEKGIRYELGGSAGLNNSRPAAVENQSEPSGVFFGTVTGLNSHAMDTGISNGWWDPRTPERVFPDTLKIEVVDNEATKSRDVVVTGACGTNYKMSLDDFELFVREVTKKIESSNLIREIRRAETELRVKNERLYKLQHPDTMGFHFPC